MRHSIGPVAVQQQVAVGDSVIPVRLLVTARDEHRMGRIGHVHDGEEAGDIGCNEGVAVPHLDAPHHPTHQDLTKLTDIGRVGHVEDDHAHAAADIGQRLRAILLNAHRIDRPAPGADQLDPHLAQRGGGDGNRQHEGTQRRGRRLEA